MVGLPGFEPGTSCTQATNINHLRAALNENKRVGATRFGRQMDAKQQSPTVLDSTRTPSFNRLASVPFSPHRVISFPTDSFVYTFLLFGTDGVSTWVLCRKW